MTGVKRRYNEKEHTLMFVLFIKLWMIFRRKVIE